MSFTGTKWLALALAAPLILAAAPSAREWLGAPALPRFVVGHEAANGEQSIREEIPAGETVSNWTRMVTTQQFTGASERLTPVDFLANVARGLAQACPRATTTRPVTSVRGGHAAAMFRADCPLLAQTGKPEVFIMLAIAGPHDLHVKQVAFRRVPTRADVAWGETFLAAVSLCEAGDSSRTCAR